MRYLFFICKPTDIGICSRILRQYCFHNLEKSPDCFLPFDIDVLGQQLRAVSGGSSGASPMFRFRPIQGLAGIGSLPVMKIVTEYSLAQKVADMLSTCLVREGLVLFDAEMNCCEALSSITRKARHKVVVLRLAHLRYCSMLHQRLNSATKNVLASIYKLGDNVDSADEGLVSPVLDTSIALLKGELPRVAKQLYSLLSECAKSHDEKVYCEAGCFIVKSMTEGYRLRFVLEGTGKTPLYLCWMENGEPKLEFLHRQGVYRTRKLMEKLDGFERARAGEEYIRSRLYFNEAFFTRGTWRNPADRFVDSYKISIKLKKLNLGIIYGHHPGKRHKLFCFTREIDASEGYDTWKGGTVFSIGESEGVPLLALVESVIPYYYNYYYDTIHVRREEEQQIILRLKEVRAIVTRNPQDEALGKIADRLLECSLASNAPDYVDVSENWRENRRAILYSHRHQLVALFDFFEWWLTEHDDCNDGFYIIGP